MRGAGKKERVIQHPDQVEVNAGQIERREERIEREVLHDRRGGD